jgi:hypothetical protein
LKSTLLMEYSGLAPGGFVTPKKLQARTKSFALRVIKLVVAITVAARKTAKQAP